jgi:integrase
MVNKVELNKLVHEILDYELGRVSKDISLEVAGMDSFESDAYGGMLQDRGVHYVGNPHGSAPMIHGLSMVKAAYDSGAPLPESIKAKVRELLADVDALSVDAPERSPFPAPWTRDQESVYGVVAGAATATGVAFLHLGKKLCSGQFSEQGAHQELARYYPVLEDAEHVAQSVTPTDVSPANLSIDKFIDALGMERITKCPLGEAIKKHVEEKAERDSGATKLQRGPYLERFAKIVRQIAGREICTSELDFKVIRKYHDVLRCLPDGRLKKYRDVEEYEFLINKHVYAISDAELISLKTLQNSMGHLRTFINDLPSLGYMRKDRADGLSEKISALMSAAKEEYEDAGGSGRRGYNTDELASLFDTKKYIEWSDDHPMRFWLPLLALYSGARMQDLLRLKRCDIKVTPEQPDYCIANSMHDKSKEGVPYIDLTNFTEKKLKTRNANRTIPIHEVLWNKLGFKKFLQTRDSDECLWGNQVKENGSNSDAFGKAFNRYIKNNGLKDVTGKLDFHSFRHTVKVLLHQKRCDESIVDEMVGHEDKAQGKSSKNYTKQKFSVELLMDQTIQHLDFHERIDILALKESKWTQPVRHEVITGRGRRGKKRK